MSLPPRRETFVEILAKKHASESDRRRSYLDVDSVWVFWFDLLLRLLLGRGLIRVRHFD